MSRQNTIESVFFRSEIHATDATATGWTAKINPASSAPGTRSRLSTRHTSTADSACRSTFVTWYGAGSAPQSRHSSHHELYHRGQ